MNNNIIIAIIVLILLGITGIVYLYSMRWRSQARAQLFIARAKTRKKRISESQAQLQAQAQATTPIQVTVVRGRSRAPPSRRPSPRPPGAGPSVSQGPSMSLPPRGASTMSRQGKRGRSRPNEWQDNRLGTGSGGPRDQSRMSNEQKRKQKENQQTGQTADDNSTAGFGGGNGGGGYQPAQQECSNQAVDDEWGPGPSQQDNTQYTGPQDEQSQPAPNDNEWRASNEAVAGGPGGPTSPEPEWPTTGDDGGQQEVTQGKWHAHDAMEQRTEQQQTDTGIQSEPTW
ncbi:hypothetical protein BDV38DRAFT_281304 [Aspergillus pseudotamarii]|uniref:Uncharacterized protein n=1 Tax=Aspergillus pseudotamarii TaxID=132259 RepID=A0A5N6SWS9_ASPPS|nr:uncharacterized protein BDV38DRAFT_281304 [Aspergillus pseudotamarii]KAE8139136.1 hypothetical protein BDV38DRAFT_281304 [Aspergillus pseudotamarii]